MTHGGSLGAGAPGKFAITTTNLPDAVAGSNCAAKIQTEGAPAGAAFTWTLGANSPNGLSVTGNTEMTAIKPAWKMLRISTFPPHDDDRNKEPDRD